MMRLSLILIEVAWASSAALGCGLDWTLPSNHFDGVEEHGYVSYWEKIGQVDLGDGLVIPVNINFNSHREASSPTLGKGWMIALLESHVEPIDDNAMSVIMPDGWTFTFLRNGNTETWRGNAGWVGEMNGAVFTIAAPCGWKIKYANGKIQEINTPHADTFFYLYNAGVACEIDDETKVLVRIGREREGVSSLSIGETQVTIALDKRPRMAFEANRNLIEGLDPSLSSIEFGNGQGKESFDFSTDSDLNPTLTITSPRNSPRYFSWSVQDQKIIKDGEWQYRVATGSDSRCVSMGRTMPKNGKDEYWYSNDNTGHQIIQQTPGSTIDQFYFASGVLAGKTRKIIENIRSEVVSTKQYTYNEIGTLIRETTNSNGRTTVYQFIWSKDGSSMAVVRNGKIAQSVDYLPDGRVNQSINYDLNNMCKFLYNYKSSSINILSLDPRTKLTNLQKYKINP